MAASRTQLDASLVPVQESDEDMLHLATAVDEGDSPKRARVDAGADGVITVDILRQLLADQQQAIGKTVQQAMTDLEARQGEKLAVMKAAIGKQADNLQHLTERLVGESKARKEESSDMKEALASLQARVDKLEQQDAVSTTASGRTSTMDERHLTTLVFGGFPRDSKRAVVVQTVQTLLGTLGLEKDVDTECFTTGPRRSFCLLPFSLRKNETMLELRARMRKVMLAVQLKKLPIEGTGSKLWCVFSKPRDAREKSGHCGAVRAAVYYFNRDRIDDIDADYTTGTCWIGNTMLSSAVSQIPDESHKVHTVTSKACKPWIDLTALAGELQSDLTEVEEFFTKSVRN